MELHLISNGAQSDALRLNPDNISHATSGELGSCVYFLTGGYPVYVYETLGLTAEYMGLFLFTALIGGGEQGIAINMKNVLSARAHASGGTSLMLRSGKTFVVTATLAQIPPIGNGYVHVVDRSDTTFTLNCISGTVYKTTGDNAIVNLENGYIGYEATFSAAGGTFDVYPINGETITYYSVSQDTMFTINGPYDRLEVNDGGSATIVKVSATEWRVTSANNITVTLD